MRPPVAFESSLAADHIDRLVSIEVPGAGTQQMQHGVARGWSRPLLIPMSEILDRSRWEDICTAVYIACTFAGIVLYVGSVRRRGAALAPRMRKHLSDFPARRATWTHLALVKLPSSLDAAAVLRCEGRIGRALDPLDNGQLPAVPGRDSWVPRARAAER